MADTVVIVGLEVGDDYTSIAAAMVIHGTKRATLLTGEMSPPTSIRGISA